MRQHDDSGMTLVELLMATTITGLLAVVIAAAFSVGVKTTDEANARLSGSQGAQITTSFFPSDVRSSATIALGATPCAGAAPTVANLDWTDVGPTGVSVTKRATYTCPVSGTKRNLVRQYAENGSLVSQVVLAYDVVSAAVSCTPGCTTPSTATLFATESGGFVFSVTGLRRAQ